MSNTALSQKPGRLIILMLILLTLALYASVGNHGFVNFDDDQYVTDNPHVKSGLTWRGVVWAFTSGYAQNWHPLTWISHMLDCQLYGLNPAGHHLTNLFLHAANVVLLFLLLNRITGATWRSGFVAALFASHPLHVESVAWIAERKDLLSVFFGMLTLLAYARYVEGTKSFYGLALLSFAFGLMSKPMLVTLPFVMLLLDFWPLDRFGLLRWGSLLVEKIPFVALAAVSSIITFLVQRAGGAVASLDNIPFSFRIENAVVSYLRYISKTFWPADLAVFYPLPVHWAFWLVAVAVVVLSTFSILAIWFAPRCPYLFTGWFWFLGTLIPVIGLVQVGLQAMADRYMYFPAIGLFIVAVWGFYALLKVYPQKEWVMAGVGIAVLAGCMMSTEAQLNYWQNSVTLFLHARAVTTDNYVADSHLGSALDEAGEPGRAIAFLNESLQINPDFARGHSALGSILMEHGKMPEAIEHFRSAAKFKPDDAELQYNLGLALLNNDDLNEAAVQFSNALRINPDFANAHCNLAVVLFKQGKLDGSLNHLSQAVRLNPDGEEAHFNYGLALLNSNQLDAAVAQFRLDLALAPDSPKGHYYLAETLRRQSKSKEAIAEFWNSLRLAPNSPRALDELAWILATDPDPQLRSGMVAIHLAERACNLTRPDAAMLTTLSAAYAEAGRFSEAIKTAEKARDLALSVNDKEIADRNEMLLKFYQTDHPYHGKL